MKNLFSIFFTLSIFSSSIFSMDIDEAVKLAYKHNPKIKQLQYLIDATGIDIKNSTLYKNPILSFGANDINLKNPNQRDLEAMQTHYITITQEIIQSKKLQLKKNIEQIKYQILEVKLDEQKNIILKKIVEASHKLNSIETSISLLDRKKINLDLINNYHSGHIKNSMTLQKIIQNKLQIDTISLKIVSLEDSKIQLYAILQDIITQDISTINHNEELFIQEYKNSHPLIKIKTLEAKKQNLIKQLKIEQKEANYSFSAGYFQRDSRDDYLNIGLKIPLNIYGKEGNNIKKSQYMINNSIANIKIVTNDLTKRLKIEQSKLIHTKHSLDITQKIIGYLNNELNLVLLQNTQNTILKTLKIKNKILDNKIILTTFIKKLNITKLNISYLRNNYE